MQIAPQFFNNFSFERSVHVALMLAELQLLGFLSQSSEEATGAQAEKSVNSILQPGHLGMGTSF